MTKIIHRLTASIALPAAAAAIIGGAAIGLAGPASAGTAADNSAPGTSNQIVTDGTKGPIYSGPTGSAFAPEKPFWNSKRDYYDNNKGGYYQ